MTDGISTSSPDWRSSVIQYIERECRPVDKFGHQPRLYALTKEIGQGLVYDDDVVFAAAWLHDIGVFYGHRPEDPESLSSWDNIRYAIGVTPALLDRFGFPATKVAGALEAIRTHQPSGDPQTLEATLVRDADILEQLGAIGIFRAVSKIGRDTRYHTYSSVAGVLQNALETLPPKLKLESSRKLAEKKVHLLGDFLSNLEQSSLPALF